jgi:general secretion pathway protein G
VGEQSRVGKVRADIAAFESALEMYSLDMYAYPNAEAGLAALKTPPAGADVATYRPGGYTSSASATTHGATHISMTCRGRGPVRSL